MPTLRRSTIHSISRWSATVRSITTAGLPQRRLPPPRGRAPPGGRTAPPTTKHTRRDQRPPPPPPAAPWLLATGKMPDVNSYNWELYHIADDYSQYNDLAAKMPDKL